MGLSGVELGLGRVALGWVGLGWVGFGLDWVKWWWWCWLVLFLGCIVLFCFVLFCFISRRLCALRLVRVFRASKPFRAVSRRAETHVTYARTNTT